MNYNNIKQPLDLSMLSRGLLLSWIIKGAVEGHN
nr:MAG TPA: hypothetical protein [Caudoviricetes sp.]